MLRTLLTRKWLGYLAVALAFGAACIMLGRWQWHRYEAKQERAQRIEAHYRATPVPASGVLTPAALPLDQDWRRVTATGRYAADRLVVRNRTHQDARGFEVIELLETDAGTIPVDRGWVLAARDAESLPPIPAAPDGTVTVTGWARVFERSLHKAMPAGQLASIARTDIERSAGPVTGGYLLMESEQAAGGAAVTERPEALDPPDTDLGPHQAYAFQWWGTAPVGVGVVLLYARREWLDEVEDEGERPERPRKPRKTRIWDEEDA
ncbi:MAG: SURF1 family protein [Micrococcales bacterium]|nr:SURF1 family protein [Micrococcales bacterium]